MDCEQQNRWKCRRTSRNNGSGTSKFPVVCVCVRAMYLRPQAHKTIYKNVCKDKTDRNLLG
ncbi:hypothetical protein EK904_005070 [Melospiza melodia maxima]|nr:hypothetical protein EK904_005070 [Melospiza melodia maxima]